MLSSHPQRLVLTALRDAHRDRQWSGYMCEWDTWSVGGAYGTAGESTGETSPVAHGWAS